MFIEEFDNKQIPLYKEKIEGAYIQKVYFDHDF